MYRKAIFAAGAALVMLAFDAAPAGAWAARHVGYTHVGPSGVYHAGRTTTASPYGYHSYGSAGHAGYGGYSGYHYGYGGYHYGYGGYRAPLSPVRPVTPVAPVGGVYGAGVYRRY